MWVDAVVVVDPVFVLVPCGLVVVAFDFLSELKRSVIGIVWGWGGKWWDEEKK